jgi:DNA recombination protein RmuC
MQLFELFSIILLCLLLLAVVWLIVVIYRRRKDTGETELLKSTVENLKAELVDSQMKGLLALRESLDSASRLINDRLAEGSSSLDRRLGVFGTIEKKLGELEQQTNNIERIGRDIKSLADILKPPKMRGSLGEILLENLLSQILPPALFSTQISFPNGTRVDAIIKVGDRLLPVDSKFPLESFQRLDASDAPDKARKEFDRTLKQHINAIHDRYLHPELKTTQFALMYIPSEAVYYQIVTDKNQEVLTYAMTKKVIPSSPGHLYAFLVSIAAVYAEVGLAGDVERLTAAVSGLLESLSHLQRFHERMEGSTRTLTLTLSKSRDEMTQLAYHIDRLKEPAAMTADDENVSRESN